MACSVVGSPETVRRGIVAFLERVQPDELITTVRIFDHAAALRSLEILAEVCGQIELVAGRPGEAPENDSQQDLESRA